MANGRLQVETGEYDSVSSSNMSAYAGDGDAAATAAANLQTEIGEETLRGYLGDGYVDEAIDDQKSYAAINTVGEAAGKAGVTGASVLDDAGQSTLANMR